ncbi:MAG: dihydroorotate dehydrogenase electron transfer subunit [Syntrophaceae bacterium]|nr:dihydroorotate dehydrogenase electron transfer subunit [Syntrophaceae bacterium]
MTEQAILALGEVLENRLVAADHFEMTLRLPSDFADPAPGQFVMVRGVGYKEPLLARPLSVNGFSRGASACGLLRLLCRAAGAGTEILSRLPAGAHLTVLGPLGTGFTLIPERQAVVIAGGVGVAPLVYLLEKFNAFGRTGATNRPVCYLGAKTSALLLARERLADLCDLRICTDDGSEGYHGLVTERLAKELAAFTPEWNTLYVCGPWAMVRSLASLIAHRPFHCQVSLEERMACGLGACLGCAVAVRNAGEGGTLYQRVCKEGPVFPLAAVIPEGPAAKESHL